MKWAFWLIGALGLGIVAYGTYIRRIDPPTIVGESKIDVADPKGGAAKITFRTRTVKGGGITTEQVELPGGTWIECSGDCRDAVRKATTDFWDEQRRKK
jgi:hypothetical protein